MVLAQNEMDKLITKVQSILSRSLLVAGTGITITLNADGTVTISTSSSGSTLPVTGTDYTIQEVSSILQVLRSTAGTADMEVLPSDATQSSSFTLWGKGNRSEGGYISYLPSAADKQFSLAVESGKGINICGAADQKLGFYNTAGVAQQTGVAVDIAAVHAALVNLGLITA